MNKLVIAGFALALVACGGGDVSKAQKLKDRACACKDQKCLDDLETEAKEFGKTLESKYKSEKDAPKELIEAFDGMEKCTDELREKLASEGEGGKLTEMKNKVCACKDSACLDKVMKDYADWMKEMAEKHKDDKAPDPAMMKTGEEMSLCMSKIMSADAPPPAPPPTEAPAAPTTDTAAAPGDTGVPECDAYVAAVSKYSTCDKVPAEARDALKSSLDQMKAGWSSLKDPNVPAEAKKAAGDACAQATDALKQSAQAMGCAI